MNQWIYIHNELNTSRFVLGEIGSKPLIIFGVNPSVAIPEYLGKSDPTIEKVKRLSKILGYDGWIMLNVYPQIATDPNDLHQSMDATIHKRNLIEIETIIKAYPHAVVVAAWGNLIKKRSYLASIKSELYELTKVLNIKLHCFDVNKSGHPKHPLYVNEKTICLLELKL